MALSDLLAALERDAAQRITRERAEAEALAGRLEREAAGRVARRREEAMARESARLHTTAARAVALAGRDAEHAVLTSREALLEQVLAEVRRRLALGRLPEGSMPRLAALARGAARHAGAGGATVRATPALVPALEGHLDGLPVRADPALPDGAILTSGDGRLTIDATLSGRLAARETEARIAILRLLEGDR